jgi:LacI family transcriptional regulator
MKRTSLKKNNQQHRVTIKDIAAMANVSIGTVDRVLHNRGEVNQETQERVMAFVEELDYTPNLLAKSLALKKSFTIAVLIPLAGNTNLYWKKPLEGFSSAASELHDFNTKIEIYHYDPVEEASFKEAFVRMISDEPSGIIMAPNFHDAALSLIPVCRERHIPLMFIDNNLENDHGLAYFGQDAHQSGIVAAKLMHYGIPAQSKVLILNLAGKNAITRHMQRREKGFTSYFRDEVPELHIKTASVDINLSSAGEPSATLKKLLSKQQPAGIFVTNSRVHKVAAYLKKNAKGRLMLIGYDLLDANIDYMENGNIDFLICQRPEDQGYRSAMAMFNYLLNGKLTEKINYSPIDIVLKENIDHYKNINR